LPHLDRQQGAVRGHAHLPDGIESKLEAHLAEVLLGFVMPEGRADFLQRKTVVDDGLQTVDR